MDNRPVGVYDSGLGGLTVWREIRRQLPEESLVYLGDGKNCPYGARPADEICRQRTGGRTAGRCRLQNGRRRLQYGYGCGHRFSAPQIPADAYRRYGTRREARLPEYPQRGGRCAGYGPEFGRRPVPPHGSPLRGEYPVLTAVGEGFVELVEEDREQSPEAVETVRRVLEPMIREGADQIVLGCTHYPFLLPVFRQVIGERGVAVVDPSPAVGRRVGQLLDQYDLRAEKGATANYGFLTFADEAYRSRLECKAFG